MQTCLSDYATLVGIMSTCSQAHAYIPPGHVITYIIQGLYVMVIYFVVCWVKYSQGNSIPEPTVMVLGG